MDIQWYKPTKLEVDTYEGELIAQEELFDFVHSDEPIKDHPEMIKENIKSVRFSDFGIESNDAFQLVAKYGVTVFFEDYKQPISQFLAKVRVGHSNLNIKREGKSKVIMFERFSFNYEEL